MSSKQKQMKKDDFSFGAEEFKQVGQDSLNNSSFNGNFYPRSDSQVSERSWGQTDFKPTEQENQLQSSIPWDGNQSKSGYNFLNKDKISGKQQNSFEQRSLGESLQNISSYQFQEIQTDFKPIKQENQLQSSISLDRNQSTSGYNFANKDYIQGKRYNMPWLFGADLKDIPSINFNETRENRGKQKQLKNQKNQYEPFSQSLISRSFQLQNSHSPQNSFKECENDSIFIDQSRINSEKSVSHINQSSIEQREVYTGVDQEHTLIEIKKNDISFERHLNWARKDALMLEEIQQIPKAVSRRKNNGKTFSIERVKYTIKMASISIKESLGQLEKQVPKQIQHEGDQAVRCWEETIKYFKSVLGVVLNSNNLNSFQTLMYSLWRKTQSIDNRDESSFANLSLKEFLPQLLMNKINFAAQIENSEFNRSSDQIQAMVFKKILSFLFRRMMGNMRKKMGLKEQRETEQIDNAFQSIFQWVVIEPMFGMMSKYSPNNTNSITASKIVGNFFQNMCQNFLPNAFSFINRLKTEQDNQDQLQLLELNKLIDPHSPTNQLIETIQKA